MRYRFAVLILSHVASLGLGVEKTVTWKFNCHRVSPAQTDSIRIGNATLTILDARTIGVEVLSESNCSGCTASHQAQISGYLNQYEPLAGMVGYQTPTRKEWVFNGEAIRLGENFYVDRRILTGKPGKLVHVKPDNNGRKTKTVLSCR